MYSHLRSLAFLFAFDIACVTVNPALVCSQESAENRLSVEATSINNVDAVPMKREVLVVDFGTIKLSKLDTLPLEMGRLEMNVPVRVKLSVENDTVKDISVVGIEVSCGCTKAMPSVSTAKPGELIPFTFDLSPDKRPNCFTHTIKINFVDLAVGVKLSGQYSLPFEFSPSVLLFKNEGGQFTANFTLRTYDKYRLAPISKS